MKKVREGYKMTELGEIPNEWNVKALSDITQIIMGQSPDSSSYNEDGDGIPFFQGKTEFGTINPVVKKWCSKPTKIAEPFDILISVRAPVGDVNINSVQSCIGRGLGAIRQTNNSYFKYIYYVLQICQNELKKSSQGSTFEAINSSDLKGLKIPVPEIEEQNKIALILSSVDEIIENTYKLIEKTKELKKGLMQKLLTKGIGHDRFKDTEIGRIPEEWAVRKLGDIAEYVNGKAFKPSDWSEEGVPIVRIQNLNGGEEFNYCNKQVEDRYYIENNELLFSWSGSRGTSFGPFLWRGNKALLNQHIFKVEIKEELDKNYCYFALKKITKDIEENAHGSAGLVHITKGELEKFKIPMPKELEQKKIALILSLVDEKIGQYESKKEKLQELKKGLMQKLLIGKIRVNV